MRGFFLFLGKDSEEVKEMKQVGIIMSYGSYEEYEAHRKDMIDQGYICMDYLPKHVDAGLFQFVRYQLAHTHE